MGRRALALGAPRYRHVGRLLLFHLRGPRAAWELLADATGPQVRAGTRGGDGGVPGRGEPPSQPHGRFSPQVGSYFGASLCALDPDGDGSAEVVLVGAPMFYGAGSGGRVAVCTLRTKVGDPRPALPRPAPPRAAAVGHPLPFLPPPPLRRCGRQRLGGRGAEALQAARRVRMVRPGPGALLLLPRGVVVGVLPGPFPSSPEGAEGPRGRRRGKA